MASIQAVVLLLLLFLLLFPLPSTPTTLYVTPTPHTPCHYHHPCHTLSQYVKNATEYFTSNTTMIFLPGEHALEVQAKVANITGFSMVGESENTSRIVCSGSGCSGFHFENVSPLRISYLSLCLSITIFGDDHQLVSCTFVNNTHTRAGLKVNFSNITFQGSNAFLNIAESAMYSEKSMIIFEGNTTFINNHREFGFGAGGGMYLSSSTVNITNTGTVSLINNSAGFLGGGMYFSDSSILNVSGTLSLTNNSAKSGGGMYMNSSSVDIIGALSITANSAESGGGMYLSDSILSVGGTLSLTSNLCEVDGGGMYVENSNVVITGSVSLIHNLAAHDGGGMHLHDSSVNITGMLSVANNYAIVPGHGGGLYLDSGSKLNLFPTTTVTPHVHFSENRAKWGGAIYVVDLPLAYCPNVREAKYIPKENCFFQVPNENVSGLGKLLVFEDNMADKAGSVLYGGSVDNCTLEGHPNVRSGDVFDMIVNNTSEQLDSQHVSVISSDPIRVCTCKNNQPQCDSDHDRVNVFRGQKFPVYLVAVGQRDGAVPGAYVKSSFGDHSRLDLGPYENVQIVDGTCMKLNYSIFSTAETNPKYGSIEISADGPCSTFEAFNLNISFALHSCPRGFTLSRSTGGCICAERLRKYTDNCNITDQTIYRDHDKDFWLGNRSKGLILHSHCPFDYCRTKLVHFRLNETDRQCEYNRTGLLCGACQPGLSLALGSSRCLENCSNSYLSLLLLFAVMGLVLIFFLFICKLTVAVGTISGLVFYANIVEANRTVFFPTDSFNPLAVFIAWLNLDLGIETCFYDGMDTYAKMWLQFAFPIYIWAIIRLIIFISGRSPRISKMLGSNPVAVLDTLVLLSYAKVLRTIISAISFTTLQYPNNETRVVWLYDANIRYLHGKHIPLFMVAVLFFFLGLPYTLLLLLDQWLQAFSHLKILSWMNNAKLRAILDAYHAPYKQQHRYWPGLLFVLRFVLLIISGTNALGTGDNSVSMFAISSASFVLQGWVWMSGKVYKNWYKDALEASFILNLGILAVATYHVKVAKSNQTIVIYISTGVAFATFIAIVLYHIYLQTKGSRFWSVICRRKEYHQFNDNESELVETVDMGNRPVVAPNISVVYYGSCRQIREPLLDTQ